LAKEIQHLIIYCEGKNNLVAAMTELAIRKVRKVVAICDADFDRIARIQPPKDVIFADFHDAEMMIIMSAAYPHVYAEMLDMPPDVVEATRIRSVLLDATCKLGKLYFWSILEGIGWPFKHVPIKTHLVQDGTFDFSRYVAKLVALAEASEGAASTAHRKIAEGAYETQQAEYSRGHDFCNLLDQIVEFQGRRAYGRKTVEKFLRLRFDAANFRNTELAGRLADWQQKNRVVILSSECVP
jgi:hypothetical protein